MSLLLILQSSIPLSLIEISSFALPIILKHLFELVRQNTTLEQLPPPPSQRCSRCAVVSLHISPWNRFRFVCWLFWLWFWFCTPVSPPRSHVDCRQCPSGSSRIEISYCCFHEGWRGGFFHYFFRSLLYFCAHLTRHPAPQRLNGRARILWHLDGLVGGFRPTLSFSRKSYFGLPRPSGLFDLHPLDARFFRLGGPSNIFQ